MNYVEKSRAKVPPFTTTLKWELVDEALSAQTYCKHKIEEMGGLESLDLGFWYERLGVQRSNSFGGVLHRFKWMSAFNSITFSHFLCE